MIQRNCIVTQQLGQWFEEAGGVSQYTRVYCGWARGRLLGSLTRNSAQDTACTRPQYGQGRAVTQRWALRHGRGPRPRYGHSCLQHDTGARCARGHARLGAPVCSAGPSWVLCAPDSVLIQIFNSVWFLSHRLDPVNEHCSSQNFSNFFF